MEVLYLYITDEGTETLQFSKASSNKLQNKDLNQIKPSSKSESPFSSAPQVTFKTSGNLCKSVVYLSEHLKNLIKPLPLDLFVRILSSNAFFEKEKHKRRHPHFFLCGLMWTVLRTSEDRGNG